MLTIIFALVDILLHLEIAVTRAKMGLSGQKLCDIILAKSEHF